MDRPRAIEMLRWTSLAPRELEFPVPGSLTSTCLKKFGLVNGFPVLVKFGRGLINLRPITMNAQGFKSIKTKCVPRLGLRFGAGFQGL